MFDKTESLVMMPLCSAFTAADKTDVFRGLDRDRKSSRSLPNTSTFVPNDRSQCLHYVLPIMRCAFRAHLDVGLAERQTPCRFGGNLTFSPLFLGEDGRL